MIDQSVLSRISEGDINAISLARELIQYNCYSNTNVMLLWNAAIDAMNKTQEPQVTQQLRELIEGSYQLDNSTNPKTVVKLELGIMDLKQAAEVYSLYESIYCLTKFRLDISCVAKVGAAVAKIKKGEINIKGFDRGLYLKNAGICLLYARANGDYQTKSLAEAALNNFNSVEVQREIAAYDKRYILGIYSEGSKQADYVKFVYKFVDAIFQEGSRDIQRSVEILGKFALSVPKIIELDQRSIEILETDVKNALNYGKAICGTCLRNTNQPLTPPAQLAKSIVATPQTRLRH